MTSIVESLAERAVGTVESVSANSIVVLVDPTAPQATALNTGSPTGFPRINGYVLIPNEAGATVGVITTIRVERSPFPKRKGMQDFGLVDLPFPSRLVTLTPLATLVANATDADAELIYEVRRGVDVFPSVGDTVALPTSAQMQAIAEGESSREAGRVLIGTSPMAGGSKVFVDPDKIFGRHLAVLGNTGAGKSCTVAGLIRWSLQAAQEARGAGPNARFVVLDPNGEYARAFADIPTRLFQVEGTGGADPLKVPAWLWNGEEWAAFTGAAPGVQRPILFDALRRLRGSTGAPDAFHTQLRGRIKRYRTNLKLKIQAGEHMQSGRREGVAQVLLNLAADFEPLLGQAPPSLRSSLDAIVSEARAIELASRANSKAGGGFWHNDIAELRLTNLSDKLGEVAGLIGLNENEATIGEDVPRFFRVGDLPEYVEALAIDISGRDVSQFVDSLNLRIRGLFAAGALAGVAGSGDTPDMSLADWLKDYVGQDGAANGPLAVIDLSLVPSEAIHVVVAVLARMVFEAVQRHRRQTGRELPTVLVLEEAHTFVHRDLTAEGAPAAGRVCCRTFERLAREGRKFGLGLVLSSQRPSEVSPTVLSQCNTFLLHRVVNDRDQELLKRLVPDGLGDLLRELPSLPSRRAILLGWGAPAPLLVEVNYLPDAQRPHSPDPAFWAVWTGKEECRVDWNSVASSWMESEPRGAESASPKSRAPDSGTEAEEG